MGTRRWPRHEPTGRLRLLPRLRVTRAKQTHVLTSSFLSLLTAVAAAVVINVRRLGVCVCFSLPRARARVVIISSLTAGSRATAAAVVLQVTHLLGPPPSAASRLDSTRLGSRGHLKSINCSPFCSPKPNPTVRLFSSRPRLET